MTNKEQRTRTPGVPRQAPQTSVLELRLSKAFRKGQESLDVLADAERRERALAEIEHSPRAQRLAAGGS